jgi:hypothetical protein
MATWTPDPAIIPWLEVVANATFVAAPIVAVDAEGMPASYYDFEIVGPRPKIIGLHVSQDAAGLVIAVPQVITGLYPPVEIEYQIPLADGGRQTGFCWDFPEIPVEADEIICFTPRKEPTLDSTFRVTAYFAQGSHMADSAEFILRVRADWTPGRDALKEAVDARRHQVRQ